MTFITFPLYLSAAIRVQVCLAHGWHVLGLLIGKEQSVDIPRCRLGAAAVRQLTGSPCHSRRPAHELTSCKGDGSFPMRADTLVACSVQSPNMSTIAVMYARCSDGTIARRRVFQISPSAAGRQ